MKKIIKKSLALLLSALMLFATSPIIGIDFSAPAPKLLLCFMSRGIKVYSFIRKYDFKKVSACL